VSLLRPSLARFAGCDGSACEQVARLPVVRLTAFGLLKIGSTKSAVWRYCSTTVGEVPSFLLIRSRDDFDAVEWANQRRGLGQRQHDPLRQRIVP